MKIINPIIFGVLLVFLLPAIHLHAQVIIEFDPFEHKLLNQKAPLFTMKGLNGAEVSLEKHRGKVVLLDFWSLSCGACFKELPELNALVKRYPSTEFVLISLMDNKIEQLLAKFDVAPQGYKIKKPIYGNDRIDFQVIPDSREVMSLYTDDFSFPRAFIIDQQGVVRFHMEGYAEKRDIPGEITTLGMLTKELDKLLKR